MRASDYLKDNYKITVDEQYSHLHLHTPLNSIAVTDSWLKLNLTTSNFTIKTLGEFTFDNVNSRIYWDLAGNLGYSLPSFFIGDASVKITSTLSVDVTLYLGLFINEILILETPVTFTKKDIVTSFGANGVLINVSNVDLLQSGSYYDFRIRAETGVTATVALDNFQTTIKRK